MLLAPTNRIPAVYVRLIIPSHRTRATDSTGSSFWAVDNNLMSVFLKIKTDLQIFVRATVIRCLQNSSTGSAVERCGQTNRHNILLTMWSGLYTSPKRVLSLSVVRNFQCSMGVFVMCPFRNLERKSWSHYILHNYAYILHNYSMGITYVFSFHGEWCLLNTKVHGHGAIEVPPLHQYFFHLNFIISKLYVPFKYSHSTLTCGM
jgi:hypothetical protein